MKLNKLYSITFLTISHIVNAATPIKILYAHSSQEILNVVNGLQVVKSDEPEYVANAINIPVYPYHKADTILHLACQNKNIHNGAIETLLFDLQANPNIQNEDYETPLHLAIKNNVDSDIIYLLLDAGANINIVNKHNKKPFDYANKNQKELLRSYNRENIENYSSGITENNEDLFI